MTFVVSLKIQGQEFRTPLTCLLDSGATSSWLNAKKLPPGIKGYTVDKVTNSTLAGTFTSTEQVCLDEVALPEFHAKRVLPRMKARVFHSECRCDMIVGLSLIRNVIILMRNNHRRCRFAALAQS